MINWRKKFWALFHITMEIMLCLNSRDGERRRKIDGFITHKNEQIDSLMLDLPKELENDSDRD